jgi:hypothetical protein
VADEREGDGGSSRTNLCRESSSCSRDGRRGRIHDGSCPEAASRLVVVAGDDVDGSVSTVFRLARCTFARQQPRPRHRRHAGSGGAGEEQGCGGERAAKASRATGGGGGESAGVVDLSSEEPNMNGTRNCV